MLALHAFLMLAMHAFGGGGIDACRRPEQEMHFPSDDFAMDLDGVGLKHSGIDDSGSAQEGGGAEGAGDNHFPVGGPRAG